MNAIEQFRAGMKQMGFTDQDINEALAHAAHFEISMRKRKLHDELIDAMEKMTSDELLAIEGGML